jgi:hypothetical protein
LRTATAYWPRKNAGSADQVAANVLFVTAEGGAARFLLPLWQRWLQTAPGIDWRIVVGDGAAAMLRLEGVFDALPILASTDRRNGNIAQWLIHWAPDALVASAGDVCALERAAVDYVGHCGGRTAQIIDTWYNYRRRFDFPDGLHLPDQILLVDQNAVQEAAAEGLPEDRMHTVGHPWWDSFPRWRPGPTNSVLFLGAPVYRDYGRRLGYDEIEMWRCVLDAASRRPDLFQSLWYGKHPEQDDVDLQGLGNAELITNSMEKISQAGTVLGAFSAPMVDAYLCGANVVSVQPHPRGSDMCPLSRHGRIDRATTPDELIKALMRTGHEKQIDLDQALYKSTDRVQNFIMEQLLK